MAATSGLAGSASGAHRAANAPNTSPCSSPSVSRAGAVSSGCPPEVTTGVRQLTERRPRVRTERVLCHEVRGKLRGVVGLMAHGSATQHPAASPTLPADRLTQAEPPQSADAPTDAPGTPFVNTGKSAVCRVRPVKVPERHRPFSRPSGRENGLFYSLFGTQRGFRQRMEAAGVEPADSGRVDRDFGHSGRRTHLRTHPPTLRRGLLDNRVVVRGRSSRSR
jgi:hypothetical protein